MYPLLKETPCVVLNAERVKFRWFYCQGVSDLLLSDGMSVAHLNSASFVSGFRILSTHTSTFENLEPTIAAAEGAPSREINPS